MKVNFNDVGLFRVQQNSVGAEYTIQ